MGCSCVSLSCSVDVRQPFHEKTKAVRHAQPSSVQPFHVDVVYSPRESERQDHAQPNSGEGRFEPEALPFMLKD